MQKFFCTEEALPAVPPLTLVAASPMSGHDDGMWDGQDDGLQWGDSDEDGDENLDEEVSFPSSWAKLSGCTVAEDDIGKFMLERWKIVVEGVKSRLKKFEKILRQRSPDLRDELQEFGGIAVAWNIVGTCLFEDLIERLNVSLESRRARIVSMGEEWGLLAGIMSVAFYQQPPTTLGENKFATMYPSERLPLGKQRTMELLGALDQRGETTTTSQGAFSGTAAGEFVLKELDNACVKVSKKMGGLFLVRKGSIVTVDDNKVRRYASDRFNLGLYIGYHRGGQRGVSGHGGVEMLTGSPLSLLFQRPGDTIHDLVAGACKRAGSSSMRNLCSTKIIIVIDDIVIKKNM